VAFVQLPGKRSGYYIYSERDKQWGTPSAIQSVRTAAESLLKAGITIGIGDISFANGAICLPMTRTCGASTSTSGPSAPTARTTGWPINEDAY